MSPENKICKAIIFDMDGTLMDSIPYHEQSWFELFRKYNIPFQPDQFHAQNHGTISEMIRRFFGDELSDEEVIARGEEKEQIYRDLYKNEIHEVKGLTPFLEYLQQKGIKIAMGTMADATNINFVLDKLGIRPFFTAITGGDDVLKGKPDPEIFVRTLDKLRVDSSECLVVEDSAGGIAAARAAGLKVIGISTSHDDAFLLKQGCSQVIADYTEKSWLQI